MSAGRVSGKGPERLDRTVSESVRSSWFTRREEKARRLERVAKVARGRILPTEDIVPALEAFVASGDFLTRLAAEAFPDARCVAVGDSMLLISRARDQIR